ncbi:uncharacterized protein [Prorops nasuta]|uniref:uncharacterized protein n=1 Tax=Prorops nasuta TaxID=863751 RepID=UPI0034CDC916
MSDIIQQHVIALELMGAPIGQDMLVFLVEKKLPTETVKKWDLELVNDQLPSFEQMCSFLSQTAIRASKREASDSNKENRSSEYPPTKRCKNDQKTHAFITTTPSINCAMPVMTRIETIKKTKLCVNCLRNYQVLMSMSCTLIVSQLLMTAMVKVQTGLGNYIKGRTLLDTCSTAHFITERFARKLKLAMHPCIIKINSLGSSISTSKYSLKLIFKSNYSEFQKALTFLTVPSIAECISSQTFPKENVSRSVDLLIGSGATVAMLCDGKFNIAKNENDLYLQNTKLGCVVVGGTMPHDEIKSSNCNTINLSKQVAKFWELEEGMNIDDARAEDNVCELHYVNHTKRDISGRYIVRLPFRNNTNEGFEASRTIALRRFHSIEEKLHNNPELKQAYYKVMQEYIDLGHMTETQSDFIDGYYMPHHAVFKENSSTTNIRVVFDASAKARGGRSLNESLFVGSTIQDKLLNTFVTISGLEVYYKGGQKKCTGRSPFLAIRTIHQLTKDEAKYFSVGAKTLSENLYVDDLISGADTVEHASQMRDEVIEILKRGGFHIRQWASNNKTNYIRASNRVKDKYR